MAGGDARRAGRAERVPGPSAALDLDRARVLADAEAVGAEDRTEVVVPIPVDPLVQAELVVVRLDEGGAGLRGDGPSAAVRYWGLTQQEYYARADVWPLSPIGEIFVILMMEDTQGIANLSDILENVPGIGAILIGEGDLSQELGVPRQYDHPVVVEAMAEVVATCKAHDVPVGHPHVNAGNVERILDQGYRFLMSGPVRTTTGLDRGREPPGRTCT